MGYAAETVIACTMKRREGAKSDKMFTFRKECQMFLVKITGKILEKCWLGLTIFGIHLVSSKYAKFSEKINISYPLILSRICAY